MRNGVRSGLACWNERWNTRCVFAGAKSCRAYALSTKRAPRQGYVRELHRHGPAGIEQLQQAASRPQRCTTCGGDELEDTGATAAVLLVTGYGISKAKVSLWRCNECLSCTHACPEQLGMLPCSPDQAIHLEHGGAVVPVWLDKGLARFFNRLQVLAQRRLLQRKQRAQLATERIRWWLPACMPVQRLLHLLHLVLAAGPNTSGGRGARSLSRLKACAIA